MMKVQIRQGWNDMGLEIIFWEELNGKLYVVEPMEMKLTESPMGFVEKPSLQISGPMAQQFLKSFAECLDQADIKTDKDARIQGMLEATRFHLEDLRTLLKLKK